MDASIQDPDAALEASVHRALLLFVIEHGHAPSIARIARELGLSASAVEDGLGRLHAGHGLVLHPNSTSPWLVHPFALSPTMHWLENARGGWWAPCLWCAFGAAHLVGGDVRIHTRIGAEAEPVTLSIARAEDGDSRRVRFEPADLSVHFPVPVARAWDNVHHFCGSTLAFRSSSEIDAWCRRHDYPRGDALSLERLWRLAVRWYGRHLEEDWRKWTVNEAREIFDDIGLTSATWDLEARRAVDGERF